MTLDLWLQQATKGLSRTAIDEVRNEIREHYEASREAAIEEGASPEDAGRFAMLSLGDPAAANRQYRKVLLTSADASFLRGNAWECGYVWSRPVPRFLLFSVPGLAIMISVILYLRGSIDFARDISAFGLALGFLFLMPLLPIYTEARSRIARIVRWIVMTAAFAFVYGPHLANLSWLVFASLWPMFWIDVQRAAIRRKLPVAEWPKHLYL